MPPLFIKPKYDAIAPSAIYAAVKMQMVNVYWYEGKAQNWGVLLCSYMKNEDEEKSDKKVSFVFFCPKKVWYSEEKEHCIKKKKKKYNRLSSSGSSPSGPPLPGMPDFIQKKPKKKNAGYTYINTCFENVIKWFQNKKQIFFSFSFFFFPTTNTPRP